MEKTFKYFRIHLVTGKIHEEEITITTELQCSVQHKFAKFPTIEQTFLCLLQEWNCTKFWKYGPL